MPAGIFFNVPKTVRRICYNSKKSKSGVLKMKQLETPEKSVVFLDIDGVLNSNETTEQCGKYIGVDDKKIRLLKKIATETNAELVLISTWKRFWFADKNLKPRQDALANYLDLKLSAHGLKIFAKTDDTDSGRWLGRGEGIVKYIHENGVTNFAILDDFSFDYDACDLCEFWVKTNTFVGLTETGVNQAVKILKKGWNKEKPFKNLPKSVAIWLDALREAPRDYVWCKSVNRAKETIISAERNGDRVAIIDCDHDLGDYAADGGDGIKLLDWLAERGTYYPIALHTYNPVGRENMRRTIERYWRNNER